ncbi:MAG: prolipoprotein diacylglyceryl transferase [Planctomycetota bacterium]
MHPKLLEIPFVNLPIYSYGFMVMLGFLTGIFILSRRASRDDIAPEVIFDIGLVAMISGIIGARILHVIYFSENFDFALFNLSDGGLNIIAGVIGFFIPFVIHYRQSKRSAIDKKTSPAPTGEALHTLRGARRRQPSIFSFGTFIKLFVLSFVAGIAAARLAYLLLHKTEYNWGIFYIWQGGLVFYGGVILAIISIIVYLKKNRLSIMKVGDLLMPGILFGLSFGRIGCFLNGCCYGKLSSSLWSVCFPVIKSAKGDITGSPAFVDQMNQRLIADNQLFSLPVHPSQIYESILGIILFIVLSVLWARKTRFNEDGNPVEGTHGFIVAYGGMLYSIGRFIIELFRGDNKSFILGVSYSQWVSIGLFLVSLYLFIWLKTRIKPAVSTK